MTSAASRPARTQSADGAEAAAPIDHTGFDPVSGNCGHHAIYVIAVHAAVSA